MSDGVGNGTIVSLSVTTLTAKVTKITIGEEEVVVVDKTGLTDTGYKLKDFGTQKEPPEINFETVFDEDDVPPAAGTKDTLTITFPGGGTLTGSGAVTKSRGADIGIDETMTGSFSFKFDGVSGPTWASGSP